MLDNEVPHNSKKYLDDTKTSIRHRTVILSKLFLKKIYTEWYQNFIDEAKKNPNGKYLEIGSGGGFLKELLPQVITSDILPLPTVDMKFSAEEMPFKNNELDAIFMINVFHHIPRPYLFFREAERTLKPGGKIIMIEPANTPLSKFIYQKFHPEPFDTKAGWEFTYSGPLSSSNQALPYIYLIRDREKFAKEFPLLTIEKIQTHTALVYTLSGGLRRSYVPKWSYGFWKAVEKIPGVNQLGGMFSTFIISKKK
jgi:SAM-dependent methyltransferase